MTTEWVKRFKLASDQRDMLINTMGQYRQPKLHDARNQSNIVRRIEAAMTKLSMEKIAPETTAPLDRVSDFSKALRESLLQIKRLKDFERSSFELLECDIDQLQADMESAEAAALRMVSGDGILNCRLMRGQHSENFLKLFAIS